MKRISLMLILQAFITSFAFSQSFTVDDLLKLASLPSPEMEHFMDKNKFSLAKTSIDNDGNVINFQQKIKPGKRAIQPDRSVSFYKNEDTRYYVLHTSSLTEYLEGQKRLIKDGFFYNSGKDFTKQVSTLYQKRNFTVEATSQMNGEVAGYTFILKQKEIPDISNVRYAEDLLQFNSHEFLISFFGESNARKDLYYFTEKELKKCTVLFGGSNRQVVFVWKDEENFTDIEYILVSTAIPTESNAKENKLLNTNEWKLRSGIHYGTGIRDLLKINEQDFKIYGNPSDLAFMIEPSNNGNIDFKKTALLLTCNGCHTDIIFDKPLVSALEIVKRDLPVSVFDIIIYPDFPVKNLLGIVTK